MTHRTEKPSQHESSTDTLISALGKIAKQLEETDYAASLALQEAAQRLDRLEKELEDMRGKQKTLRDEFAWLKFNEIHNQLVIHENDMRYHVARRKIDLAVVAWELAYKYADAMMEARKQ